MPRPKGTPKTGGRTVGSKNHVTPLVRERCRALIEDPAYQANFYQRLHEGKLPPVLEAMTWHYAYNKPIEMQEISGKDGAPVPIHVTHKHVHVTAES